jgi:hypothetical protein
VLIQNENKYSSVPTTRAVHMMGSCNVMQLLLKHVNILAISVEIPHDYASWFTTGLAKLYIINACTVENLDRNYKNRNIYILSDSQAAIEVLGKDRITSKLVWDCRQSLIQLTKHNRLQVIWVPGHKGIVGNEMADQLARTGSDHPFIGPEPACGISIGATKKAVRDRINRNHKKKKTLEIHNWIQTGKGTYTRALCQKNKGSAEVKQSSIKIDGRTIYRTLSPKRTPFQTGFDR